MPESSSELRLYSPAVQARVNNLVESAMNAIDSLINSKDLKDQAIGVRALNDLIGRFQSEQQHAAKLSQDDRHHNDTLASQDKLWKMKIDRIDEGKATEAIAATVAVQRVERVIVEVVGPRRGAPPPQLEATPELEAVQQIEADTFVEPSE